MEFESVTLRFEKAVALNSEGRINGALTSTKVAANASSGIVPPAAAVRVG